MRLIKIIFVASLISINSIVLAAGTNKVQLEGSIDGISKHRLIVIDESVYKLHSKVSINYSELNVGTRVRYELTDGRISKIQVLR